MSAPTTFLELFHAHADASDVMPFDRFMTLALYDPVFGYYRRDHKRVGYGNETDFFTASTSGDVFGELICAAVAKLLADHNEDARNYTFVEIGAETDKGILAGVTHPFIAARTIRVGEDLSRHAALAGRCIVFSNELFDAQPFRRLVLKNNQWHELGVGLDGGKLTEVMMPLERSAEIPVALPTAEIMPENYHLDLPCAAVTLAQQIAAQPWQGLFLACDYGKSWRELTEAQPAGTARAYYRHTQTNDLLARPGEQDLTCHICWDWLAHALTQARFVEAHVESQESFFIRHAESYLATAFAADAVAPRPSERKRSLMQLLHPAHLGQKFQALYAYRT